MEPNKLKWFAYSPIQALLIQDLPIDKAVKISERLKIDKIPDWATTDEALEILDEVDKSAFRSESYCLCADYEAEALHSPDPKWKGEKPRSIQEVITEEISLFPISLWIEKPTALTLNVIGHIRRDEDRSILRHRVKYDSMPLSEKYISSFMTQEGLSNAIAMHKEIFNLDRGGTMWTAIRLLFRALSEQQWNIRFLLFAIALEALFGPADSREITYRLSTRVSKFLHRDSKKAKEIFNQCKNLYSYRSKIVHGMKLSGLKSDESVMLMEQIETIIRELIKKIILNNQIAVFEGKEREKFLDEIVFD